MNSPPPKAEDKDALITSLRAEADIWKAEVQKLTLLSDSQLATEERMGKELEVTRKAKQFVADCRDRERVRAEKAEAELERLVGENQALRQAGLSYEVRKQLWLTHGCGIACLYGDDGEMQCGRFFPFIDFRRDGEAAILEGIEIHYHRRAEQALLAPPTEPKSSLEGTVYDRGSGLPTQSK